MIDPHFECVVAEERSSVRCFHRTCRDLATDHPWHFHPEYELTLIIQSSGTRYIGDHVARYQPGDLVISGPGLPHCWRNDAPFPDDSGPEWIVVQFDPGKLGLDALDIPEIAAIRNMLHEARCGIAFQPGEASDIGGQLRQIVAQSGMTRLIKLAEILDELSHIPRSQLATQDYHWKNAVDHRLFEQLDQVQRYISERFRGYVSQAEIADRLGMTAYAFSKFFRNATGRTFMSLVKLTRINEGCRLLAYGTDPITDVALQCGYQHTSHFDRHFKELKVVSPTEYRRRMRTMSSAGSTTPA